jgi:hypothetical protein
VPGHCPDGALALVQHRVTAPQPALQQQQQQQHGETAQIQLFSDNICGTIQMSAWLLLIFKSCVLR